MLPRPIGDRLRRVVNESMHRTWAWMRVAGAISPNTRAGERFGSFGEGSIMGFPYSVLYGEAHIHVGENSMINTWATISAGYSPDQVGVPERCLVIGDRCVIGMRSGIVAHESIEIGDDVWFGQDVYVTDANHGYQDPNTPIGVQLGGHSPVRIGSGSWLGHGTVVLAGTTMGRNVVVAAGSVVRGDIPDHAVIGGVPAKVIRRLEPGVGWVRPDGEGDVKPIQETVEPEELFRRLRELEELQSEEEDPPSDR